MEASTASSASLEDESPSKGSKASIVVTPFAMLAKLDQFLSSVMPVDSRMAHTSWGKGDKGNQAEKNEVLASEAALFLLRNLPPARQAILTYLAQALSRQVWLWMPQPEPKRTLEDSPHGNLGSEVEELLGQLVEEYPNVWAPVVAGWAVDQLGRWSIEWETSVVPLGDATLEERVAAWLACNPAHSLSNLTVLCMAYDPDTTVAALLEHSMHGGPALDWLVAHVGCSFPSTVIGRVLTLGLRSFAPYPPSRVVQQLKSVNTILSHLAQRHYSEILKGLDIILEGSFSGSTDPLTQASIPYLLQLARSGQSRAVASALTSFVPKFLQKPENLLALNNQLNWWIPKYFPNIHHLIDLLVHLLMDTGDLSVIGILQILLHGYVRSKVNQLGIVFPSKLLSTLVSKLCSITYMHQMGGYSRPHIPFLAALGGSGELKRGPKSLKLSLTSELSRKGMIEWVVQHGGEMAVRRLGQLLTLAVVQQGSEASLSLLMELFQSKHYLVPNHLYLVYSVMVTMVTQHAFNHHPAKSLTSFVASCMSAGLSPSQIMKVIKVLEIFIVGGKSHDVLIRDSLSVALSSNLSAVAKLVNMDFDSSSVLEVISQLPIKNPKSLGELHCLSYAIVSYFMISLQKDDAVKLAAASHCNHIIVQLNQSAVGHSIFIRLLVEAVFCSEWAFLFGAIKSHNDDTKEMAATHLLETNLQFDTWVKFPRSHNAIFHTGIIGMGKTITRTSKVCSSSEVQLNVQLLLTLIANCCQIQGSSQSATTIALLLVELLSPDIMFNGFPWPEENIKFTFERDLTIKSTFEQYPVAWHLMQVVAQSRPALCYCSVLVRALTAALMSHWSTCPLNKVSHSPSALGATVQLLEIMIIGQFLPPVFSVLPQMVSHLAPYEVVYLLQDVWAYMSDNTPSPDSWTLLPSGSYDRSTEHVESRYTDSCRKLIQVHIKELGHLLHCMVDL